MPTTRSVILRNAVRDDAQVLLDWRNDPETRQASRKVEPVSYDEHTAWLSRVLADPSIIIQIGEIDGAPVGVVRAHRIEDGWELSWTVAPEFRQMGIGAAMLSRFTRSLSGRLVAVVRKDNVGSAKVAGAGGLRRKGSAGELFDIWCRE